MQLVLAVHHENLVGVVGQFVQAAQIAQHHFQGDIFAHPDHFKVHDGAHAVFRIAHGFQQLRAFFFGQAFLYFGHHVGRQVGRQVGKLIGVHAAGGGNQVLAVHRFNQRFPHPVFHFQQHVGVVLGADQLPDGLAFILGQRFQDEGDVGRMQAVQQRLEFGFVLAVNQVFDQRGLGVAFFLAVHQVGHQLLAAQAFLHFGQGGLCVFRVEAAGRRGRFLRGGGLRHALRLKE